MEGHNAEYRWLYECWGIVTDKKWSVGQKSAIVSVYFQPRTMGSKWGFSNPATLVNLQFEMLYVLSRQFILFVPQFDAPLTLVTLLYVIVARTKVVEPDAYF